MTDNLFANLPKTLAKELVDVLVHSDQVRIERIVSTGHVTPKDIWYDQDEHEWVAVLSGEAVLRFVGVDEPQRMKPGDHVLIPAHRKHRVEWTTLDGPTVWLTVFFKSGE